MIELVENYPKPPSLFIDGKLVDEESYQIDELEIDRDFGLSMNILGVLENKILLNKSLDSFPLINYLQIVENNSNSILLKNLKWLDKYTITFSHKNKNPRIDDRFKAELEIWLDSKYFKNDMSYAQYLSIIQEIKKLPEHYKQVELKDYYFSYEGAILGAGLLFDNILSETPLIDEIEGILSIIKNVFSSYGVAFKNESNSFSTFYSFPEEIKISCEQYLLYFTQFLKDLGIIAISDLKEEAGKVLFSVTPTDDIEALGKIREALAIYLNLPASPIVYDDSFAAMRLQQQIENLQHSRRMAVRELQFNEKLLVAQSDTIREKNITISHQQTVIEQKDKIIERILSKSVVMDSLENKEEFEKIFDGLEVGESKELKEKLGIKFNPVTSLKSLGKALSGSDDEITSLNLNEEDEQR